MAFMLRSEIISVLSKVFTIGKGAKKNEKKFRSSSGFELESCARSPIRLPDTPRSVHYATFVVFHCIFLNLKKKLKSWGYPRGGKERRVLARFVIIM